ncbi:MAG: hypothetical protein JRF63_03650 [Deltaproteobacteria bacterium]|nr:hypothetical protein [Deltaproteobacteria bacterium]
MTFPLPMLARVAAFGVALTIAGTSLAYPGPQQGEPPPPPGDEPPPPPPPPPPDQPEQPAGAPPAEYKSSDTQTWGATGDQGATAAPAQPAQPTQPVQPDPEKEALKKKCEDAKKKGQPPSEECKSLELDIVFQGGIQTKKGPDMTKPQATDTESAPVLEEGLDVDTAALMTDDGKLDVWEVARREPVLFASQRRNFLSAGVYVGYPLMFGRGSTVESAYQPVIHVGAEIAYQALRLFQIALVFDFDYMKGLSAYDDELRPLTPDFYADGFDRPTREIGAILDDYLGFGLRPSFRLTLQFLDDRLQTFLGAGFGWHYFKTSGRWRTKLPVDDPANQTSVDSDAAQWQGTDFATYKFDESDSGLYSVFELALIYRWLDARLGTGVVMQYTVPIHGNVEPNVTVQQDYGMTDELDNPVEGYSANENDYGDSFVRHLSSLSFLTFNLFVDFRF